MIGSAASPGAEEAADLPGPDLPDPHPALTVAAVARRLGVAPATLRTWDRRYGLGPSQHAAGTHRRYGQDDLARLSLMRRLTLEGLPPAEAAELALRSPAEAAGEQEDGSPRPGADAHRTRRAGGGRVVALPDAEPAARGLARAAMSLDTRACDEILAAAIRERGIPGMWEDLLLPVLVAVGERWAVTGQGVDVEHALSECVMAALRARAHPPPRTSGRPAVLAAAETEEHTLPLHVMAAVLAEHGVATRLLGARVPPEALASAVRRSGPAAVFIWSALPGTGSCQQLAEIPTLRPAPRVVIGGPGWRRDQVPAGVHVVETLDDAVEQVLAAAGR